ncbi:MAG: hypothetical protein JNK93_13560, partial [Planctomycetia bacterium]|nr:hypothetical protein [Planctomycetia bacterium]
SRSIELPPGAKDVFPYDQPIVFRSDGGRGRYVVHERTHPIDRVEYDPPHRDIWKRE